MAEVLLGYNIFEESDSSKTIHNILEMDIPQFNEVRNDVDEYRSYSAHCPQAHTRMSTAIRLRNKC